MLLKRTILALNESTLPLCIDIRPTPVWTNVQFGKSEVANTIPAKSVNCRTELS